MGEPPCTGSSLTRQLAADRSPPDDSGALGYGRVGLGTPSALSIFGFAGHHPATRYSCHHFGSMVRRPAWNSGAKRRFGATVRPSACAGSSATFFEPKRMTSAGPPAGALSACAVSSMSVSSSETTSVDAPDSACNADCMMEGTPGIIMLGADMPVCTPLDAPSLD